jgi:HD superfamily phosphohydrolase YqeK
MARVSALMEQWARDHGLGETDVARWAATGLLHDVLRDARPADLLGQVAPADRELPPGALHGPGAANRLESLVAPGVAFAIRHHTLGHPDLDDLGCALYLADYLEPGRGFSGGGQAGGEGSDERRSDGNPIDDKPIGDKHLGDKHLGDGHSGSEPTGDGDASDDLAVLRSRVPTDLDGVMVEVVSARIRHLLDARLPIHRNTADLWESLVGRKRP